MSYMRDYLIDYEADHQDEILEAMREKHPDLYSKVVEELATDQLYGSAEHHNDMVNER